MPTKGRSRATLYAEARRRYLKSVAPYARGLHRNFSRPLTYPRSTSNPEHPAVPRRNRRRQRRHKRNIAAAVRADAERVHLEADVTAPVVMYYAGWWREIKVRFCQALFLLVMSPTLLFLTYEVGYNPAEILSRDGYEVSWPIRYATAALALVGGIGTGVLGIVYGWCYITRAVWDPVTEQCRLTLAGLLIPVRLDVPAATGPRASFHHGFSRSGGHTVNAPYDLIRIPGRRLPLILDYQGYFPEPEGDLLNDRLLGEPELVDRG